MKSPHIKLWVAKYEDMVVAGALCFYSKNHVVYWHGAADSDHFDKKPVNLLMYNAIEDACEHSYKWFDFNPSAGIEGVRNFKIGFGAKALPCPVIISENFYTRMMIKFRSWVDFL